MILSFFLILILLGIGAAFSNELFTVMLSFYGYEVRLSVFTMAGMIIGLMWIWALLLLPFKWLNHFSCWREKSRQEQKQMYFIQVLEALVNHDKERYPLLIKQAQAHLDTKDMGYWLVLALLQPSEEVYQKLLLEYREGVKKFFKIVVEPKIIRIKEIAVKIRS